MEPKPISCLIPQLLKDKRQSQQWLAEMAGMSKQQLSDYIAMRHIMGMVAAKKLASILGCMIDDLYKWEWQQRVE